MNPQDILRYVDSLHREKNIDKELVFIAIESALQTAAKRQCFIQSLTLQAIHPKQHFGFVSSKLSHLQMSFKGWNARRGSPRQSL